ncbi:MAG: SDR family oxidoreductase [Sinobacteraceae bacterium]|nr:SDR family oxidoreductase [Nevskiaceae bacterium]
MDIRGRTIIITGAGRGIGRAIAQMCAARGADLALLDLTQNDLTETAELCSDAGVRARCYQVDVSAEASVSGTLDAVVSDFGRLDALVNNAGILRDSLLVKVKDGEVVGKMTLDQWQAVIDVNLTGVFLCAREAAERMIRLHSAGVIVNISSISRAGNAGQTNYTAAKAGVAAMTVVWAKELARHRIRVGAVAPGFVRTPMVAAMKPDVLARVTAPVPLGRLAESSEIAHAVGFILENEFFTGRVLEVDGGLRL